MTSRRKFLKNSAALTAGSVLLGSLHESALAYGKDRAAASDQLRIGAIGVNGMGWTDTLAAMKIPGVRLGAICDVDQRVIAKRMQELEQAKVDTRGIQTYGDYRLLLENKDLDAVIIGTPDHWHALIMMDACAAGKDVYCEKPVGNSIGECRAMGRAKNKYGRAVQVGQWQRSQQHFKDAVDFARSGALGNIRTVKVWCYQGWMKPGPVVPDSPAPAGVDYAMWLGPAPTRSFNASRFHFNFRWFWDYAGGLMTDWGVHLLDYGLLGMNAAYPKSVAALGGRFAYPDLYEETPDTLTTLYEFEDFNMVWDSAMGIDNGSYNRDHGIAYIGNNGTLILNRAGWEVIEEKGSSHKVSKPFVASSDNGVEKHVENFIQVAKSRKMEDLHCPIEAAIQVATVAQMGNIAYRSAKKLQWNLPDGKFMDREVNDAYYMKQYHNGYQLPAV